jgi:enoyl-CoA hydratase
MDFENLLLEEINHILIIKLNREEVRNALDEKTWFELGNAVDYIKKNDDIHAVIITGGEKVFAAGADIKWLNKRPAQEVLGYGGQDILWNLERLDKPVIAAVGGYALGGGCELAMACDIRIASEKAKFGQPEVGLGLIPGAGGTQRLSRLVGLGKAKELIFTGNIISAEEAKSIGLVNQTVQVGETLNSAIEMAEKIMKKGPVAIRLAKLSVNASLSTDSYTGMSIEKLAQTVLFSTEDRIEGTSAFLEKRSAEFKGR